MATDLHERIKAAIDHRLARAQAAAASPATSWTKESQQPYLLWMLTAPEQLIIRACRADLERLNEHAFCEGSVVPHPEVWCHKCSAPAETCTEVRRLAAVYVEAAE